MSKKDTRTPPRAEKVRQAEVDPNAYKRHLEQNPGSDYDEATNSARPAISAPIPPRVSSKADTAKFVRLPKSKIIKTEGLDEVGGNSRPNTHVKLLPGKGPHSNPEGYTGLGSTQQPALDGQKVRYDDKAEPASGVGVTISEADYKKKIEEGNAAVRKQPKTTSVNKMGITKDSSKTEPNSGALKGEAK